MVGVGSLAKLSTQKLEQHIELLRCFEAQLGSPPRSICSLVAIDYTISGN
ncbi:hypothetical protein SLEP1_g14970 [Rubroshorea leprosula]|uniref:Uncharacterized protein n=1 Tax=Rubroshorea leprosula TaxID=152421 RepID=A0AAV5IVA8_9ROSI|nr:hypothetical protein SLEP1_g14970 [Rubroshorea leprosula]